MSDVAAPPALLLRRRSTLEALRLDASLEIGAGGEARVFSVPGDRALVAKIYHEPSPERARKVALMIDEPPRIGDPRAALAWPVDLLLGEDGRFAGFLMPRAEGPRLFELYNPITRRRTGALCDHAMLHRAGAHVAAAFDALHARGYVVGDVNESNVLLKPDGTVTLVDADSFQVRDPDDGTVYRSKVGKAEFTPPELQGRSFADFDRAPEHDRFGLGVLLFLALMEGTHPFAGRMDVKAETPPVEERIRRGLFPHHGHPEIHPPKLAPPFAVLDPGLRALFVRCFTAGHADPAARPSAGEWREALVAAEARMKTCGRNPRHRFGPHLDACPWCERTAQLHGRDPFPLDPQPVPRAVVPAPRRAPVPPRRAAAPASPLTRSAPRPAPFQLLTPASPWSSYKRWVPLAAIVGIAVFRALVMDVGLSGTFLLMALAVFVWQQVTKGGIGGWTFPWKVVPLAPPTLPWMAAPPTLPWMAAPRASPTLPRNVAPPAPPTRSRKAAPSAPPVLSRKAAPSAPPPSPRVPSVPSDARYVKRLLRAGVPRAAIFSPRPGIRVRGRPSDPYRIRFGTLCAEDVDHPPRMMNGADLERRLGGHVPPPWIHPMDWTMRIALRVDESGRSSSVKVVGRKPDEVISPTVIEAVSRARFHPMTHKGSPVAAWVWFDVTFEQP